MSTYKKRGFAAGEVYHTLNRGVEKRNIFLDDEDRFRFIHDLFEFNDTESVNNTAYFFQKSKGFANRYIDGGARKPRKLLVDILAFAIMPNHYHLLLRPRFDDGASQFMKKINVGYANYFNKKYKRSGALFQGRYKSVHINNEAHFIHIPYYIHFNPLDLHAPGWRKRELKSSSAAIKFLGDYRWSSHLDYLGKKNFPSVTQREFLLKFFGGHSGYENQIKTWLKDLDTENLGETTLE